MKKLLLGNEAVARGAWEAGVEFATGYPGTPSTEVLESLARYSEPALRVQWAPNEKVAYEVGMGASLAGARTIVTMKHVGLNVAADPFFSSAYMGVNAGFVVLSADDPGMHSSQGEQDNRLLARAARVVMIEPSDAADARWMTREAFALSERFDTPVLLRMTTRVCHQTALVQVAEREPDPPRRSYKKDIPKNVLLPAHARQRRLSLEDRLRAVEAFADESEHWNPIFSGSSDVGVVTSGVSYGYVRETLPHASILKLGVTYPLPMARIRAFAATVKKLYVMEELEPYVEDAIRAAGIEVEGSALRPPGGELNLGRVEKALLGAARAHVTIDLPDGSIPGRPPTLCPGCGHRGMFTLFREMKLAVLGDIGCYTLGALKPLAAMDSCLCMGASIGMAQGMTRFSEGRVVGVIGDSTFFHSGIPALMDMVVQESRATIVILDNRWTAMTGAQPNPGTGVDMKGRQAPRFDVAAVCRALGVNRVREVDPYRLDEARTVLEEELAAPEVSVVVAVKACLLGSRASRQAPLSVDVELCDRCGACIRVGCMGLRERRGFPEIDPRLCTGCGVCEQVCETGAICLARLPAACTSPGGNGRNREVAGKRQEVEEVRA